MNLLKLPVVLPLFVSAMCFLFAGCGDEDNPVGGSSPTELEGTWVGTADEVSGEEWTFVIKGNTIQVSGDGMELYKGTFTLNMTTDPKQFTCKVTSSVFSEYVGKEALAIYRISGNSLDFAGNEPGNSKRPTSFTSSEETMVFAMSK